MTWSTALFLLSACAATGSDASDPPRVVAIGDLHGDLDNALDALQLARVADAEGHWTGGDTILVQTGDTTDRGPDSKAVLDLLRNLRGEAEAKGGKVVLLLGNHEVMNLMGDWRYVHPGDVDQFGGLDARKAALSPAGEYGAFLRGLDVAARVQGTVFVHGGIAPTWAEGGVDALNARAHAAIEKGAGTVLGSDGPLWYREYVQQPEEAACPVLKQSLVALEADRMVVGHTTRRDGRIQVRCGGRLHVIDIGISDAYGGHVGVWEMVNGDARALYPTQQTDLEDPTR